MTYQEAVNYILEIPKFTKKNDREHTRAFLRYLGDPQEHMKVLHVAGTNGKGSVCAYLDGMLRSEGKRTGLFTSPHLVKMNERIVTGGEQISDAQFCAVFEKTRKAVQRMEREGLAHPTFFEFLLGMALLAFAEAGTEDPAVCVITSIGLDHMEYLGHTLGEIAGEKAGIIRTGVPVFYAQTAEESDSVIARTAEERGSFCKKIGKDAYEILGIRDKHIAFSCSSAYYGNTTWKLKGRMEEVLPDVYVDGAHNISAVEAFTESLPEDGRENMILFSAVRDKDYEKMAECLCRKNAAALYVVTHIDDSRGAAAQRLADIFRKYTEQPVIVKESVKEALAYALGIQDGRRIYCLGSLYLAGMIKGLVQEER